jgi:5-methylthioribose kinase
MLIANFWMSYFSQAGHEASPGARDGMRAYLLDTIDTLWETFRAEFAHLWRTERKGILYQASLFEDRNDPLAAEQALNIVIDEIWREMLGFAGIEIHRRILGLAHNADFETITDPDRRAPCESKALKFGRHLAVNRQRIHSLRDIRETVERLEKEILA